MLKGTKSSKDTPATNIGCPNDIMVGCKVGRIIFRWTTRITHGTLQMEQDKQHLKLGVPLSSCNFQCLANGTKLASVSWTQHSNRGSPGSCQTMYFLHSVPSLPSFSASLIFPTGLCKGHRELRNMRIQTLILTTGMKQPLPCNRLSEDVCWSQLYVISAAGLLHSFILPAFQELNPLLSPTTFHF